MIYVDRAGHETSGRGKKAAKNLKHGPREGRGDLKRYILKF